MILMATHNALNFVKDFIIISTIATTDSYSNFVCSVRISSDHATSVVNS